MTDRQRIGSIALIVILVAATITMVAFVMNNGSAAIGPSTAANAAVGGYVTIEDEGTPLSNRSIVDIQGAYVTCIDAYPRTECTWITPTPGVGGGGAAIEGQNNLTPIVPTISAINAGVGILGSDSGLGVFTLDAITATPQPTATAQPTATVNPAYRTIQEEGVSLTQRELVNIIGAHVTCVDNAGSVRTDCTWLTPTPGAGGSGIAYKGTSDQSGNARCFGCIGQNDSNNLLVADTIYYFPWFVDRDVTVEDMESRVQTAGIASSVGRVCVFEADVNWQPTTLVNDFGTVAVDSTGIKVATTGSAALTASQGRYLVMFGSDGAPTMLSIITWSVAQSEIFGPSAAPFNGTTSIASQNTEITTGCSANGVDWDNQVNNEDQFDNYAWADTWTDS